MKLIWEAEVLGQEPDNPVCVYRAEDGQMKFITGKDMTEYLHFVARLVHPRISDEKLKLISTHSIRVTACCLLAKADKDE